MTLVRAIVLLAGSVAACAAHAAAQAATSPGATSSPAVAAVSLGLLPVHLAEKSEQMAQLRGLVESALDVEMAAVPHADVVDRTRVDKVLAELAFGRAGRADLQAGQIVGAEVLIAAELVSGQAGVTLKLSALETATGNVLLETSGEVADGPAVNAAVKAFASALPARLVRKPHAADVAFLPITHTSPFPAKGELAEDLRQRLARRLESVAGVRVLHRELAQFVLVESQMAAVGLVDPKRKFTPVAAAITIRGDLKQEVASGRPLDESTLTLTLTVRGKGHEKTVRASGTLARAAEMELSAARDLCGIVAELAGQDKAPAVAEDKQSAAYWEAQRYLAQAGPQVLRRPDGIDEYETGQALELVMRAAALISDSPEPYMAAARLGLRELPEERPGGSGDTARAAIRRRFIDGFPRHASWPTFVSYEQYSLLGFGLVGPLKPEHEKMLVSEYGKKEYEQAVVLAEKLADSIIAARTAPCESHELRPSIRLLILNGQYERALAMCVASARPLRLCGWSPLNDYVCCAIDVDQMDWAYRAAELQRRLYPGYEVQWLDRHGRRAKLSAPGEQERWKSILDEIDRKSAKLARGEAMRKLPAWGQTRLVDREVIGDLARRQAPLGNIMSISSQGGTLLAILRDGNRYLLWTVEADGPGSKPVELAGLPPLVPPNLIQGYVMRPSIATFDGQVFVGAEHLGLFAADPPSGRTARVADGFPDGSVHALVVANDSLYAAGGGKDAGFIARRPAGRNEWKVWIAPTSCGPVRRVAPRADGPWRIYHAEKQRLSLFDPKTGKWDEGFSVEQYAFGGAVMASLGERTVMLDPDWDTQHPMYLLNEAENKTLKVCFPPNSLWEYLGILQRHEVFWSWTGKHRHDKVAPLSAHPADAIAADGHLWILDAAGGLTATADGRSFAGPFGVATAGASLGLTDQAICVVAGGRDVVFVPRDLLARKLAQPNAFRDSQAVLATVTDRLNAWLTAQPVTGQIAYFNQIRRPDLAAKITAAHPEIAADLAASTLREQASKLVMDEKYAAALKLLAPYGENPRRLIDDDLEWSYLWSLHGTKQWQPLLEIVPKLWKVSALSDAGSRQDRLNAYFHAVQATASKDQFERVLWDHITGRLPVVPWRWDENPAAEYRAWEVRWVASDWLRRHLAQEGRAKEIESNPLIAPP